MYIYIYIYIIRPVALRPDGHAKIVYALMNRTQMGINQAGYYIARALVTRLWCQTRQAVLSAWMEKCMAFKNPELRGMVEMFLLTMS